MRHVIRRAKKINDDKVAQAKAGSSRFRAIVNFGECRCSYRKHLAKPVYTIDEVNAIDSKRVL
jgi:hypothetical protein